MANSSSQLFQATWGAADTYLRGVVPRQQYGNYIIPFTVLRRLECLLEPTKAEVIEFVESSQLPQDFVDSLVAEEFGTTFYNTSSLSLEIIASTDDNVQEGLMAYIAGFSDNVVKVFESFEFSKLVDKLADGNVLWGMIKHYSTLDLSPGNIGEHGMGDLFENLMYRSFSENGQVAGEFYTPRDAIRLMVDILLRSDDKGMQGSAPIRSVYDPTAGTAGMLLTAKHAMKEINEDISITLAGQELMAESYALGASDLIVSGEDPDVLKLGDTLTDDQYADQKFDYVLANPPYGTDWKRSKAAVEAEAKIEGSRFNHGLPPTSDGQMLFLTHIVDKLTPKVSETAGGGARICSY
ncbi:type I restriction-modification system subunit M [Corynebacterium phocae]|uniref:type I restriction-modification system subunit M n=1 Tax=Corynebacterium phocae TaxID=161895 RepID=UPI000B11B1A3|nr:class I SAM-dependent DNA methyltransferase [Corynebacterium phocae]